MNLDITQYIKPELLVLIPVLYLIGIGVKHSQFVKDKYIPILLGSIGIILALLWSLSTSNINGGKEMMFCIFTAIIQGVLCAGGSTYTNQLIKQISKEDE